MSSFLAKYKKKVDQDISDSIPTLGPDSKLRDACEYALKNGGKRIRPIIVHMVADALNNQADVKHSALGIEFLHTASLAADDLPCMDDDDERREIPSLHCAFSESLALLASYTLISVGYEQFARNGDWLRESNLPYASQCDKIAVMVMRNATENTGLFGATAGQFMDIYPPSLTVETMKDVIHKKTVSLFEIAFVAGWLFGGGNEALLPQVKQAAYHYGMAFQIADDIGDIKQDETNGRQVNLAGLLGKEKAILICQDEILKYHQKLKELGIETAPLLSLTAQLI